MREVRKSLGLLLKLLDDEALVRSRAESNEPGHLIFMRRPLENSTAAILLAPSCETNLLIFSSFAAPFFPTMIQER
jgi:hypothetical protein